MPRKKTSKAVIKSARINPINPQEKDALDIINELEGQGYSFKEIVVDAVLQARGRTPEMYSRANPGDMQGVVSQVETLLADFAQEIITSLRRGTPAGDERENDEPGEYARTFAASFMQRQRQAQGDDE